MRKFSHSNAFSPWRDVIESVCYLWNVFLIRNIYTAIKKGDKTLQNENENDKKYGHRVSGGVIVSLIMAIGLLFLVGDLSTNGEGRVNIPLS